MGPETKFRNLLIKEIESRFPGSIVLRNDPENFQGVPDLTVLFPGGKWALLECKRSSSASHRPNQDHYISLFDEMFYASFIFPENKDEVLDELQQLIRQP